MNQNHYFEACVLTDRFSHDDQQVEPLLEQINDTIDHFSADCAYDETPVYNAVVIIHLLLTWLFHPNQMLF